MILGLDRLGGLVDPWLRVRFVFHCGAAGAADPVGDRVGGAGRADRGVDATGRRSGGAAAAQFADVVEAAVVGRAGEAAAAVTAGGVGSVSGQAAG